MKINFVIVTSRMFTPRFLAKVGCKTKQTQPVVFLVLIWFWYDCFLLPRFKNRSRLRTNRNVLIVYFPLCSDRVRSIASPEQAYIKKISVYMEFKAGISGESLYRIMRMKRARPRPWFIRLRLFIISREHIKRFTTSVKKVRPGKSTSW